MKEIIADTSVAIKWFARETQDDLAEAILGAGASIHAPGLLMIELANGLWKKTQRGEFLASDVQPSLSRLRQLVDHWHGDESLIEAASRLSLELAHPVYDCLYLALAADLGAPLVTADKRLLAVAPKGRAVALEEWRFDQ